MSDFWGRVASRPGGPVVRSNGVSVGELIRRLEAGEPAQAVVDATRIDAADLVSVLAHDALGEDESGGLPLVQGSPRRPALSRALGEESLTGLWPNAPRTARLALSAGLYQVYDFWDPSHHAAQQADDLGEASVSAYWHGIAHRREPDAGNASYWFRRVGRHPLFPALGAAARPLVEARDPSLAAKLFPGGSWDPYAVIDFCTRARGENAGLALALQRLEMIHLLGASLPA
ncbi:MAG: hypothetical protein U0835_26565 [Isosphaeraceae bacterium]